MRSTVLTLVILMLALGIVPLVVVAVFRTDRQTILPLPSERESPIWKCRNFDIVADLSDGWRALTHVNTPGDAYDRPGAVLAGFAHRESSCVYVLKIEKDVPLEQLSMAEYLAAVRKQLTDNKSIEFVDESQIELHERLFHRLRYLAVGTKGPVFTCMHIHRDGRHMISTQWIFPMVDDESIDPPTKIVKFANQVKMRLND